MTPRAAKHVHKLKRHTYTNKESVYFCVNDCRFKINVRMSLGKTAECWRCGKPFTMNEYSMRLAKPHCQDCTNSTGESIAAPILEGMSKLSVPSLPLIKDPKQNVTELRERLYSSINRSLKDNSSGTDDPKTDEDML